MCEYCHNIAGTRETHGHHPRCPSAPEPIPPLDCAFCGSLIFEEESHRYLRDIYCDECWEKFLRAESVNFTDDYIAQREKEYYTSWFESEMLSDSERLDAIKRYYLTKKALDAESLAVDRYMFFAESEDFFEYVEKRVRE